MDLQAFSARYRVRALGEGDVEEILALCAANPLFFRYHPPAATRQSIREDLRALPPGKALTDKYYLGFFAPEGAGGPEESGMLAAVLDLILGWPRADTAYLGLFMVAGPLQGRGVGSGIIAGCLARLAALGFSTVRLAVDEGNPQSLAFWQKNGFVLTGERIPCPTGAYLPMERGLGGETPRFAR